MNLASKISGLTPEYEALVKLKQKDNNNTYDINPDTKQLLKDLDYINENNDGLELTDKGKKKAIELQQQVEKTGQNLISISLAAIVGGITGTIGAAGSFLAPQFKLGLIFLPAGLFVSGVLILGMVLVRGRIWSNVN